MVDYTEKGNWKSNKRKSQALKSVFRPSFQREKAMAASVRPPMGKRGYATPRTLYFKNGAKGEECDRL